MRTPPAPWCCLLAAFDGVAVLHAGVCPYAAERQPQPDVLVSLSELLPKAPAVSRMSPEVS